jgi:hypothetical protein
VRTDFAAIESELQVIQKQVARLPTRRELAGTALGIIFATMMLTTPEPAVLSALVDKSTLGACAGYRLGLTPVLLHATPRTRPGLQITARGGGADRQRV